MNKKEYGLFVLTKVPPTHTLVYLLARCHFITQCLSLPLSLSSLTATDRRWVRSRQRGPDVRPATNRFGDNTIGYMGQRADIDIIIYT